MNRDDSRVASALSGCRAACLALRHAYLHYRGSAATLDSIVSHHACESQDSVDGSQAAGYEGKVKIGMDVAASEFMTEDGKYDLNFKNKPNDGSQIKTGCAPCFFPYSSR